MPVFVKVFLLLRKFPLDFSVKFAYLRSQSFNLACTKKVNLNSEKVLFFASINVDEVRQFELRSGNH